MRKIFFFAGIITLLVGCISEPVEPNNNSGRLMSITSYGGDSAQAAFQYQKFTFVYDNVGRVIEIKKSSNNLTVTSSGSITFLYSGSSLLPYIMIDSTTVNSWGSGPSISKTFFYYDALNRKIKDSTYNYWRSGDNFDVIVLTQPVSQHIVNSYTYAPDFTIRRITHGLGIGSYFDSLYIGPNNDYYKVRSQILDLDSIGINYYTEMNPQSELNVTKSLIDILDYWGVTFHPFEYDMNKSLHLPESIICKHYEGTNNQTINLRYYYSKNTAGKINKIVVAKRRNYWPSGTLFDFYYFNYLFDYYP